MALGKRCNKLSIANCENYNNWGGLVKPDDVSPAKIVLSSKSPPKVGACRLIFFKLQVMADGTVNACACRDANATLAIGNLNNDSLKYIISRENETYMQLILNQESGLFNEICTTCDFYDSIYKSKKDGTKSQSLGQFLNNN